MPSRPELDAGLFRMPFVRVRPAADGDEDNVCAPRDEPFWRHDVHDRLAFVLPPASPLALPLDFRAAPPDDRVREREVLEAARSPDLQRVRRGEGREARDDVDAVPLAELADAVHEALHDGRFPLLQPDEVHLDRSRLHAAFPGALDRVDEVPGVDEGLARDAPVVQALAAEPVALDEEDALPELCGPDR